MRPGCRALTILVPTLASLAAPGAARAESITPGHTHAVALQVSAELDAIRGVLEAPKAGAPRLVVHEAQPSELFYPALELLQKARRLSDEQVGVAMEPVQLPDRQEITSEDVHRLVSSALDAVRGVRDVYLAEGPDGPTAPDTRRTPSDVYNAILAASRQIDPLLDRRVAPADVDRQLSAAFRHVEAMLAKTDAGATIAPPDLDASNRPADVHAQLLACFEQTRRIGARLDVAVLRVEAQPGAGPIEPADVQAAATLIVSQVAALGDRTGVPAPAPSDVASASPAPQAFRNADRLQRALSALEQQLETQPAAIAP